MALGVNRDGGAAKTYFEWKLLYEKERDGVLQPGRSGQILTPYQDGGDELSGHYQDLVVTLRVLAKSLGFLEALPYATGKPLSEELAEVTGIVSLLPHSLPPDGCVCTRRPASAGPRPPAGPSK